ncbi:MAG: hypothetical protein ACRCW2_00655 [Cellulosilyticaceae bacterium]
MRDHEKAMAAVVDTVTFGSVRERIYEKEQSKMKQNKFSFLNKKKVVIVGGCCMALLSMTVVASSLAKSWVGASDKRYTQVPTATQLKEDIGFAPKYVGALPGGYTFQMGGKKTGEVLDDKGQVIGESTGIVMSYKKPQTKQIVDLNAEKLPEFIDGQEGTTRLESTYKGCEFYLYEQTYKFVPEGYELTAQDRLALEAGKLEVSYGSHEVSLEQVQSISWEESGIHYSLMGNDLGLTVDEWVEMAKAVIDVK